MATEALEPAKTLPFLMEVEEAFAFGSGGTAVIGPIQRGAIRVGDEVEIVGLRPTRTARCTRLMLSNKAVDEAEAGARPTVALRVGRDDIERGQALCQPGTISAHAWFSAEIHMLPRRKKAGARAPVSAGYRPQLRFRAAAEVTGQVQLQPGADQLTPGAAAEVTVTLISPIALEERLPFTLREAGRAVGSGVVTKIIA